MLRRCAPWRRGQRTMWPLGGAQHHPVTAEFTGVVATLEPLSETFANPRPMLPRRLRCIPERTLTLPMLHDRQEQLMVIENALAHRRTENQVSQALSQLSLAHRSAEYFITHHVLNKELRPSIHAMWFHDRGLRGQQAVLSSLAPHHLVPLFSLLSYDFEHDRMTLHETEALYHELMDSVVAHQAQVQRELANGMIRAYALADEADKGVAVLLEMKRKGIRRTFVSYAPLFRLARLKNDAELHERLDGLVMELENGPFNKLMWIDLPRVLYALGVFIRYNWWYISVGLTALFSLVVCVILRINNLI